MISNDDIHNWAVRLKEIAKESFDRDGRLVPFVSALFEQSDEATTAVLDISSLMTSDEQKDVAELAVRKFAETHAVYAVVMVAEAWAVLGESAEECVSGTVRASQHPQRKEVVLVRLESHSTRILWLIEIVREGEKPLCGNETEQRETDEAKILGRFANFLTPIN